MKCNLLATQLSVTVAHEILKMRMKTGEKKKQGRKEHVEMQQWNRKQREKNELLYTSRSSFLIKFFARVTIYVLNASSISRHQTSPLSLKMCLSIGYQMDTWLIGTCSAVQPTSIHSAPREVWGSPANTVWRVSLLRSVSLGMKSSSLESEFVSY